MSHIDPDDLALIALRPSTITQAQRAHLEECVDCSKEERELARTVELGRAGDDAPLMAPPPAVWSRISRELGLSGEVSAPSASVPLTSAIASSTASRDASPVPAPVVSIGERVRRRVWPFLVAAAAVGVLGGLGIATLLTLNVDPVTVIAEAALDPLPGYAATGNARVEESADGRRDVVVTLDGADDGIDVTGESREVWLLTSDASGLVSLGFLDGSVGRFAIPADIDLGRYPLVDVSVELLDGDPAHSGDSVVRGELQAS